VRVGIVATVAVEAVRPAAGATLLSPGWRDSLDPRQEWRDVVGVSPRQQDGSGDALGVRDEVVHAPQLPSIRRVRTRLRPPKPARTDDESPAARDQSRGLASCSFAQSPAWRRRYTPARCQARRGRPQVIPEPQPGSWGSISQGSPFFQANKMPVSTWRGGKGWRPGQRTRRGLGGGNSGSSTAHHSSAGNGLAM
jgi:hypothetical protein